MKPISFVIRILSVTIVLCFVSALYGQTPQNPFPISGPMTITAPGYYRLTRNIVSSAMTGNIITIQQHNVTIDFNTFFIVGPNNKANTVVGISANEFGNITIKNGTIAFCEIGIKFDGNGSSTTRNINQVVDNMRISNCWQYGVNFPNLSPGSVVSNCLFSQIGGTTNSVPYAAAVFGASIILTKDNLISNVTGPSGSPNQSYGIATFGIDVRNAITDSQVGISSGKYQNNLTVNVTTPVQGGTDAGGNN